jgi:O-antigen biosynthesis protein WbqP
MYKSKAYNIEKRVFDVIFALLGLIIFLVPILLVSLIIKISSEGPVIHWSYRKGIGNKFFRMAKFRTLKNNIPASELKLMQIPEKYLIVLGKFLRKSGIDEIPQLFNILKGDMSFVGPRPVIENDAGIQLLRNEKGIYKIKPGLTGLAQINGRCSLTPREKVFYDEIYMKNMSMVLDIKILFMTNLYLIAENIFTEKLKKLKLINIHKLSVPERQYLD